MGVLDCFRSDGSPSTRNTIRPILFADRQESGPFAWWYHRHHFVDDGQGGTILRDEVEYQAPLGRIGHWLGGWLIRRKLDRMFCVSP